MRARKTTANVFPMTHTPAPSVAHLVSLIGTADRDYLAANGWTNGHAAGEFAVGDVVFAYSRGTIRRGVVIKLGRTNITFTYVTDGGVKEALKTVERARHALATLPSIERSVRGQEVKNAKFYAREANAATAEFLPSKRYGGETANCTDAAHLAEYAAKAAAHNVDEQVAARVASIKASAEDSVASGHLARVAVTDKIVKAVDVYRYSPATTAPLASAEVVEAEVVEAEVVEVPADLAADVEAALKFDTREAWLNAAVDALRPVFTAAGHVKVDNAKRAVAVPAEVLVSVGWPGGKSMRKVIGQCWPVSTAGVPHLYVSPTLGDPVEVLGVLVHELVHAWDDCEHGHRGDFAKCARRVGLVGKMTSTTVGDELRPVLVDVAAQLGAYPHKRVTLAEIDKLPKQGTRMLKVVCPGCDYTLRTTAKWVEVGLPTCVCGTEMELAS